MTTVQDRYIVGCDCCGVVDSLAGKADAMDEAMTHHRQHRDGGAPSGNTDTCVLCAAKEFNLRRRAE